VQELSLSKDSWEGEVRRERAETCRKTALEQYAAHIRPPPK